MTPGAWVMHVMYFTEFAYLRIEITRKLTKYLIIEQAVLVHLLPYTRQGQINPCQHYHYH
jgi:hypothetical protein